VERSAAIRVLLVEDNEVFRDALELMLDVMPDVRVVGAVSDGQAAVDVCRADCPDVVLMDYRLPGLDGVLTAAADQRELDALAGAGAVACLTKDSDLTEIVGAIRDAAARGATLV
jgi:DNA-binding NarL/FixJ family response regulator